MEIRIKLHFFIKNTLHDIVMNLFTSSNMWQNLDVLKLLHRKFYKVPNLISYLCMILGSGPIKLLARAMIA
jgi:hypothetical protein